MLLRLLDIAAAIPCFLIAFVVAVLAHPLPRRFRRVSPRRGLRPANDTQPEIMAGRSIGARWP
jgi:hypothetical protein